MRFAVLIAGLPDWLPDLLGFAGTLILVLMLIAIGGYAYKSLVGGGIEWPEDIEEDVDEVRRGDADDEWDYY